MALIIVAGDKGSPGVTTAAVALAAAWPRHAILAECDPHGGDLVYRLAAERGGPLDPNTGLLSVAIAARRGFDSNSIPQHLQRVHGGLDVLVGLGTAEQAGAVTGQWSRLARSFDQFASLPDGGDVIADCGRVGPASPALEMMPHAALVLLVARADAEQVAHVRDRANGLSQRLHGNQGATASIARPPIGVVLIAKHREAKRVAHQVGELLSATAGGAEVLGVLAEDSEGAAALCGRVHARVDKSLLMRSARDLANSVTARYALFRQEAPAATQARAAAAPASPAGYGQRASAPASASTPTTAAPSSAQSYQYPSAQAPSAAPPPSAAETTAPMPPIRDAYAPPVAPIYSAPQPRSADQQSYQYSYPPSSQPPHQSRYPQQAQHAAQQQSQYPQSATHYHQPQYQAPAAVPAAAASASAQPPTPPTPAPTTPQPKARPESAEPVTTGQVTVDPIVDAVPAPAERASEPPTTLDSDHAPSTDAAPVSTASTVSIPSGTVQP